MNIPVTKDVLQENKRLEIPEIRVWYKPIGGGSDEYKVFKTFEKAIKYIKDQNNTEDVPLIAFNGYEINLWGMEEGNPTTEPIAI